MRCVEGDRGAHSGSVAAHLRFDAPGTTGPGEGTIAVGGEQITVLLLDRPSVVKAGVVARAHLGPDDAARGRIEVGGDRVQVGRGDMVADQRVAEVAQCLSDSIAGGLDGIEHPPDASGGAVAEACSSGVRHVTSIAVPQAQR